MATTPVPVEALQAAMQQGQDPQPQGTQPIKINIGGQEREFQSVEELNAALNATFQQYNTALAQAQQKTSEGLPGKEVTGREKPEEPKVDLKEFIQKLERNPIEAFDYIDQARFGVNPRELLYEMAEKIQTQNQALLEQQMSMSAYQFRESHPEFVRSPQNSQALLGIMQQYQLPFTTQGFEMAYALGRTNGWISTQEAQPETPQGYPAYGEPVNYPAQQYQPQPQAPAPPPAPYNPAPPRVSRGTSGASGNIEDLVDQMSPDEIMKVISQFEGRR